MLEEYRAPTKVRLAALWASTMFCYIYGDYFGLYVAGTLADMNHGSMGPLGHATPGVLTGVSPMFYTAIMMGRSISTGFGAAADDRLGTEP